MVPDTEHRRKGYGSKGEKLLEEKNHCPLFFPFSLRESEWIVFSPKEDPWQLHPGTEHDFLEELTRG